MSRTSRTSPSSLASRSSNAAGVPPLAADEFCAASPPASPSLLALPALAPEIAEHFAEVERLGRASYWRGEIGRADSGIEQAHAAKELAVCQYAIELGKVYADSSRASSCGRSASKGKGRARLE